MTKQKGTQEGEGRIDLGVTVQTAHTKRVSQILATRSQTPAICLSVSVTRPPQVPSNPDSQRSRVSELHRVQRASLADGNARRKRVGTVSKRSGFPAYTTCLTVWSRKGLQGASESVLACHLAIRTRCSDSHALHPQSHHASTPAVKVSCLRRDYFSRATHASCRTLDPILGVFTGAFAYYLYETHPRTALPQELRLMSLLRWKREKWQQERERRLQATEELVDWQAIAATVEGENGRSPKK